MSRTCLTQYSSTLGTRTCCPRVQSSHWASLELSHCQAGLQTSLLTSQPRSNLEQLNKLHKPLVGDLVGLVFQIDHIGGTYIFNQNNQNSNHFPFLFYFSFQAKLTTPLIPQSEGLLRNGGLIRTRKLLSDSQSLDSSGVNKVLGKCNSLSK